MPDTPHSVVPRPPRAVKISPPECIFPAVFIDGTRIAQDTLETELHRLRLSVAKLPAEVDRAGVEAFVLGLELGLGEG